MSRREVAFKNKLAFCQLSLSIILEESTSLTSWVKGPPVFMSIITTQLPTATARRLCLCCGFHAMWETRVMLRCSRSRGSVKPGQIVGNGEDYVLVYCADLNHGDRD